MLVDDTLYDVGPMRMDPDGWAWFCEKLGLTTDSDAGRALGISHVTVWRVRTGRASPGPKFTSRVADRVRQLDLAGPPVFVPGEPREAVA